jgi:hypothetical protein
LYTAKRRSTEGADWQALIDKEAGLYFILIRLHGSSLLDKLVKLSEMTPVVPNKLANTAGSAFKWTRCRLKLSKSKLRNP